MADLTTYDDVNNAWGGIVLAPIKSVDAAPIFRKLVRKFGGRKMRIPGYAGRANKSWAAPRGTDTKSPRGNGVPRMVHDASHWVFEKLHPAFKTHSAAHAALELAMIQHVVSAGWHLPKMPPPPRGEALTVELTNVEARIKRWEAKAKRAATALRKLSRKRNNLRRRMAAGVLSPTPAAAPPPSA